MASLRHKEVTGVIVTRSKPSSRRNMAPCLQFTGVSTTVTHNPSSPSKRARRFHHRRPATVTASASVTPVRAPLNLPSSLDRRQQNRKLATTTVRRVVMAFMGRGLATCPVMTTGTATAARCCVGPAFSADSSSPPNFAHRRRRSVRAFAAGARSGTDTGDRPDVARRGKERTHLLFLYDALCSLITCRESRIRDMVRDVMQLAGADLGFSLPGTLVGAPCGDRG